MTVYFIRDAGGDVKIGYSERDPFGRLATMQTGNPRALTLLATIPGDRSVERELHDKFSSLQAYAPLSMAANMLAEIMERSHGS